MTWVMSKRLWYDALYLVNTGAHQIGLNLTRLKTVSAWLFLKEVWVLNWTSVAQLHITLSRSVCLFRYTFFIYSIPSNDQQNVYARLEVFTHVTRCTYAMLQHTFVMTSIVHACSHIEFTETKVKLRGMCRLLSLIWIGIQ